MNQQWLKISGIVKAGYQVASGKATNSPYPEGTIKMQIPFFQALGLDLTVFFPGTLNISIYPYTFQVKKPTYNFRQVRWNKSSRPEDFSFSPVKLSFKDRTYSGLIYYPHPETKPTHFQDNSTLEILAPFIEGIDYGIELTVTINSEEISLIRDE